MVGRDMGIDVKRYSPGCWPVDLNLRNELTAPETPSRRTGARLG